MSVRRKSIDGSVVVGLVALSLAAMTSMASSAAAAASIVRFQGADRFATSAAIVQASYSPGVPVVYIATGLDFPDALAGGAAAAKAGGPLLLVRPDLIPTTIAAELTRLTPASIVVLGGTGAVSAAVMSKLETYTSGAVTRVSGVDRYATAANLASSFPTGSPVFIATGRDFPDALAGTAAAAAQHAAILLTTPTTIPPGTAAALSALAPSSITILGGTGVVSASVATQLRTYTPTVTRLSGSDRYATAAAIATSAFPSATGVFITTGAGFADALTGGPVAGAAGQPMLLATLSCLPAAMAAVVAADAPTTVTLLGGTGVLGAGVASLSPCAVPPLTAVPAACTTVKVWASLASCGWAGPGNTGYPAGQSFKSDTNGMVITANNTVIDGWKVSGGIEVRATNVVIRNSWVTMSAGGTSGSGVININPGASATIERTTIDGLNATHTCIWHEGISMKAVGNDCSRVNDGIFMWATTPGQDGAGDNFTIQDNWLHGFTTNAANGHIDGIQTEGAKNGVIRHNTIDVAQAQDSAIALWNSRKSVDNVLIDHNLMQGGGFATYAEDYSPSESNPAGGYSVTRVTYTNNVFSTSRYGCVGQYGVWYTRGKPTDGWNRSGNYVLETGQKIDSGNPSFNGQLCT